MVYTQIVNDLEHEGNTQISAAHRTKEARKQQHRTKLVMAVRGEWPLLALLW